MMTLAMRTMTMKIKMMMIIMIRIMMMMMIMMLMMMMMMMMNCDSCCLTVPFTTLLTGAQVKNIIKTKKRKITK